MALVSLKKNPFVLRLVTQMNSAAWSFHSENTFSSFLNVHQRRSGASHLILGLDCGESQKRRGAELIHDTEQITEAFFQYAFTQEHYLAKCVNNRKIYV